MARIGRWTSGISRLIGLEAWRIRRADRVVLGAGGTAYPGWVSTNRDSLDVTDRTRFARYWAPDSRCAFVAEHVWEHLDDVERRRANDNCFEFLRSNGWIRIAVPDGLHPDRRYIERVRPGGSGRGADDHRVLLTYRSLASELERSGFSVRLLEHWDEDGRFHARDWASDDGHIVRSRRFDPRNGDGRLRYTSLIVDAVKP